LIWRFILIRVPISQEGLSKLLRFDGSGKMIDVSLKGVRCRAAQEILDIEGTIGAATEGTIVYELEGEGGQLVNVRWDDGTRSLVSSEEIVITDAVTWQ
jgi:hypothetical protein